ncbi:MAG TPA: hypothetical protein VMX17_12070 [Candidatus Glassbacteria bacterium]|nr:hypothetical protein [Candidatus Glassbacteria bacterium]
MVACKYGGFSIKPKVETDEEYKKRVEKRIKEKEELNGIIEILSNKLSVVELDKFLKYIRVNGSEKLYDGIKEKLKNLTNGGWKNW